MSGRSWRPETAQSNIKRGRKWGPAETNKQKKIILFQLKISLSCHTFLYGIIDLHPLLNISHFFSPLCSPATLDKSLFCVYLPLDVHSVCTHRSQNHRMFKGTHKNQHILQVLALHRTILNPHPVPGILPCLSAQLLGRFHVLTPEYLVSSPQSLRDFLNKMSLCLWR